MNVRLHIVAPYESMLSVIQESLPLFPELTVQYSVGDLESGVSQAIAAEQQGADLIISRGGTARLIKRAVTIPVIDMQLSGYDMIRSLMMASNLNEKTAIVGFANITSGAQAIIDLLDLPLKAFTVSASEEVAPLLLDLKSQGYKQIAGDVITLKTANAYGLRGFLIQSGKESIVKALEDAKLIYGYLHKNDHLTQLFERMILHKHANLIIVNTEQRIIYERLTDYSSNPLQEQYLTILDSEWAAGDSTIVRKLAIDGGSLRVKGYRYTIDEHSYTLYALHRDEALADGQNGIQARHIDYSEPLADRSPVMRQLLHTIRTLYERCEPICLQGDKGTGKAFIIRHIHQELSPESLLLAIDLSQSDLDDVEALSLSSVATVKLLHPEQVSDQKRLIAWIRSCREIGIRIFLVAEQAAVPQIVQEAEAGLLIMPALHERLEDIEPLTHYFLSQYHQRYGSIAVKLQAEALALLQRQEYPGHVDDLRELVKKIALNERDYVIQAETIRRLLDDDSFKTAWAVPQGTLKDIEKDVIQAVLQEENYNQSRTAERLGINRATLWRKLKG